MVPEFVDQAGLPSDELPKCRSELKKKSYQIEDFALC